MRRCLALLLIAAVLTSPACRKKSDESKASTPPPGSKAEAQIAAEEVAGLKGCLPDSGAPRGKALQAAAATNYSLATARFAAAGKVAPAEMRDEYAVVVSTMRKNPTLLGSVDGDYNRVLTDPKFARTAALVQDPEFRNATARLKTWYAEHCASRPRS